MAKSLGQNNREKASRVAGNGVFLASVIYVMFVIFGITGVNAYISTQTSNSEIKNMAVKYLTICCIISFGITFFSIFEKVLQATGKSMYSTIAQILGAVVNIILDPILIYGLFGMPKLGVSGAAYATVVGQIVSLVAAVLFHLKYNVEIDNAFRYKRPSMDIIKEIYAIGLPAIIAQALMSFMTYILNVIFVRIDESVVTAYGLYYKIQQFILFAAFGLRDAITPIVSFNHGMKSSKRVKQGIKYGLIYTFIIMAAGFVLIELFANQFGALFGLSGTTEVLCVDAMRIVSISFVFAGANIAFQGIFQAVDSGIESLIISLCRQLVFIVPLVWVFTNIVIKHPDYMWIIWTSFPITEIATSAIAFFLMKKVSKNKITTLEPC